MTNQTNDGGQRSSRIPFEELALNAAEVGDILGYSARTIIDLVAAKPNFPKRLTLHPATWRAGDIIEWRDANRGFRATRRKSKSKSSPHGESARTAEPNL